MKNLFVIAVLLYASVSTAQTGGTVRPKKTKDPYPAYTNEFFLAGGYAHDSYKFFDAGLRYYHWRNDGQTIIAFAGASAGCEFSLHTPERIYIPYAGWQGQMFFLAYGIRAEYAFSKEKYSFGFTPEAGISIFEMLRVTGGYRCVLSPSDPFDQKGFRFSLVFALPLSMKMNDEDE